MELLPRSAFPRDLPAVPGPGRHGDGRDRGTAQEWRSGCPLAVAVTVTAVTLQRRNARCRAFRTVRAAELHGANQDEHTFDSMLEHLRCQNPSMDPIQREGEYVNRLVCPWCNGGNKREETFSVRYKNGILWCRCWRMNKCGRTATYRRTGTLGRDFGRPASPRATPSKPKEVLLGQNMIELTEEHQEWFRKRGISKETLERNRICSKQTKNGKAAIVFPYYEGEKLVAEKLRALPKTFWQTPGGQKSLYGVDDVKDQKEVVITEGEIDKLSFDEACISWSASLQNGASAGFDGPNGAVELFASAERVVLAVDGDAAGKECAAKLAEQLSWRRCYMVKWPAGCKDANEVLLKHGKDALRKLTEDAQLIPCPWEMRLITEETSRLVQQKINGTLPAEMVYGVKTGWDSLDHLWRPVLGEVTVVTGVPGHGKSEFLLSLAVNLGHLHNYKTLLFAFESTSRYLATQLYLKATGTCPNLDQQRDDQDLQYRESLKWVDDHIIVECDFQSDEDLTVDGILEKAEEEAAKGMKCLIIDPYNFIDRSKEEAKTLEHHYIGNILQRLRKFAEDFGVHVIIVAHPTKASSWDGQKPTLYTIAGSSNWFNKTDNGLVIYRREIDDGAGGTVPTNQLEIVVEKVRNREAGQLGRTMLCFDFESRCYSDLSQQDAWTLDAPEPSRLESVSRRVPAYAAMDDEDDEY